MFWSSQAKAQPVWVGGLADEYPGKVEQSEGNNLEHDTAWGQHNSLVQVDSDTYALAYGGLGDSEDISHGWISTFTISSDFKK